MAEWGPARALLLWAAVERVGCGPTWVVLTCGFGVGGEAGGVSVPGEVKGGAMMRMGTRGRSFRRDVV